MLELMIFSAPIVLIAFVYKWFHEVRTRKYLPWTLCGVSGFCDCALPKVCAKDHCKCPRSKVCIDHSCRCARLKACPDAHCNCGRLKVNLEPHSGHSSPPA